MKTSTERILTTHTGSLPRPASLTDLTDPAQVRSAVEETVRRQRDAGIDIVNDGEASKPSYATYVTERMSGFGGAPAAVQWPVRALGDFPEFFARERAAQGEFAGFPTCSGPVAYTGLALVEADIANLKDGVPGREAAGGQGHHPRRP